MDNAYEGGIGGSSAGEAEVFGTPESFEQAFAPESEQRDVEAEVKRSFGEVSMKIPEVGEMPGGEPAIEVKPLVADGSTEGKLGRIAVSLTGDVMDKESEKQVHEKISELKKNPYELSNYRDEEMADSLRDNFGRIFGNDDIGEIQAEANKQGGAQAA